jgi:hypothetical protein
VNRQDFKTRWESDENGGGITFDDVAACYVAWGIGSAPRTKPIGKVMFSVLKAAATVDADDFDTENEGT